MKSNKIEYVGKDLEAMDFAVNYHLWIFELLKPYLGDDLVEVGAGTGAFSELLLKSEPKSMTLIEPSAMFEKLKVNPILRKTSAQINYFQNVFTAVASQIKKEVSPDTFLYVNVLEHIENDQEELMTVQNTLNSRGRVCIFVPAMPLLYSQFDKNIGHFRRYRKKELTEKCRNAGFKILLARNFDFFGVLPWLIKYRILGSTTMESGAVKFYDDFAVPFLKQIEGVVTPPFGKNLLVVGEKTSN